MINSIARETKTIGMLCYLISCGSQLKRLQNCKNSLSIIRLQIFSVQIAITPSISLIFDTVSSLIADTLETFKVKGSKVKVTV